MMMHVNDVHLHLLPFACVLIYNYAVFVIFVWVHGAKILISKLVTSIRNLFRTGFAGAVGK